MITSTSNAAVKALVLLQKKSRERREQGLFVIEGLRIVREAPADRIVKIYLSESFAGQLLTENSGSGMTGEPSEASVGRTDLTELLAGKDCELLSDQVFAYVSDTQTPQGILAVVRMREYSSEELFADKNGLWLILENVQDPGNLGTMFRTAEGAGVSGIIMDRTTVDIYNPKTVRSTMGSIFRVPFMIAEDLAHAVGDMQDRGVKVFAACAAGSLSYSEADFSGPTAFLIGNEANGLTDEMMWIANERIFIPMRGQMESLNASMAAGILMYEADRQRRAL